MNEGWVKLYRNIADNPTVMKDAEHLAVWIWLLIHANHKRSAVSFGGKQRYLKPGELTTGRKRIASELRISETKVQRILKRFEIETMIKQETDRQCRLISIINWDEYQVNNGFNKNTQKNKKSVQKVNNEMHNGESPIDIDISAFSGDDYSQSEQRNAQQVNNEWTTSEQRVNTKQEGKEGKNVRNKGKPSPPSFEEVCDYVHSMNYEMDPEAFYDYYQDTNWTRKNGMHIKDWQAAVRSWERREKRYREEHGEREQEYKPIYHKPAQIDPLPEPTPMPDYMKKLFGGGN